MATPPESGVSIFERVICSRGMGSGAGAAQEAVMAATTTNGKAVILRRTNTILRDYKPPESLGSFEPSSDFSESCWFSVLPSFAGSVTMA